MNVRAALMIAVIGFSACGESSGPPIVVNGVTVTAPAPGMPMAAGYFEMTNRSGEVIRITSVTSPAYESVEIHETIIEDDIARMRAIPVIEIADGETVIFERGGKHLMLMRPRGSADTVTLNFFSDDTLLMSVSAELQTIAE